MNQTFLPVLYTVLQIAVPVFLGFFFRRITDLPDESYSVFGRLVVTLTLPLYFFVRVSRIDPARIAESALFPLSALIIVGAGIGVSIVLARIFFPGSDSAQEERRRLMTAMGGFGNSGYLPVSVHELLPLTLPAAVGMFGNDLPTLYIGAYIFVQSPLLWSVGNYLVTGKRGRIEPKSFISTPIIGIVLGLVAGRLGLAEAASSRENLLYYLWYAFDTIGSITVPLVLLTLGGLIAGIRIPRENRRHLWRMAILTTVIRLAIIPAAFWAVYSLTGGLAFLAPAAVLVLFLEAHTPTASNFTVMAARAGRNHDEVALTLLTGYVTYLLVFPAYLYVFLAGR